MKIQIIGQFSVFAFPPVNGGKAKPLPSLSGKISIGSDKVRQAIDLHIPFVGVFENWSLITTSLVELVRKRRLKWNSTGSINSQTDHVELTRPLQVNAYGASPSQVKFL